MESPSAPRYTASLQNQVIEGLLFPLIALKTLARHPFLVRELRWTILANFLLYPLFFFSALLFGGYTWGLVFPGVPSLLKWLFIFCFAGILLLETIPLFGIVGIFIAFPFLHHPTRVMLQLGQSPATGERHLVSETIKMAGLIPLVVVAILITLPLKLVPLGWFLTLPLFGLIVGLSFIDFPLTCAGVPLKEQGSFILRHIPYLVTLGTVLYFIFLVPLLGFFIQPLALVAATTFYLQRTGQDISISPRSLSDNKP